LKHTIKLLEYHTKNITYSAKNLIVENNYALFEMENLIKKIREAGRESKKI